MPRDVKLENHDLINMTKAHPELDEKLNDDVYNVKLRFCIRPFPTGNYYFIQNLKFYKI